MALDVGEVRTGIAVTDPLRIIASPHSVIETRSEAEDAARIAALAAELEVSCIVVGLPLNREGEPGPQARKVLAFVDALRAAASAEVVTQDERFSTAAAERMLIGAKVRRKGRKQVVDKIAATHILQAYLDRQASAARRGAADA